MNIGNIILISIILFIITFGIIKKVDVFDEFMKGASEGLQTAIKILPALVGLMFAVGLFSSSGALDLITNGLTPIAEILKIPKETIPLAIMRPISGSGGLALLEHILHTNGPDSYAGRVASVLYGSSETLFYTIAIYFGSVNITRTRHTVPSALVSDITGLIMSTLAVRLIFY